MIGLPPHRRMSEGDHQLATYNSEVARGLVHTDEWKERMRLQQSLWDSRLRMDMEDAGAVPVPGGGWMLVPQPEPPSWWRRVFGGKR